MIHSHRWPNWLLTIITSSIVFILSIFLINPSPAYATLNDDSFDGNIFALYAGNGSLVPPKAKLADSLARQKPALLLFYLEDSSDCKQYSIVISQLQAFYGRVADFIPTNIDSILPTVKYTNKEPGYYYKGLVPQTVLIDQNGQVVLDLIGQQPLEKVDDKFREIFDLLPRSESLPLKRRQFNEINVELVPNSK